MCDDNIIPFRISNKHRRRRNVCDDNNVTPFWEKQQANTKEIEMHYESSVIPFIINNKKHQRNRNAL